MSRIFDIDFPKHTRQQTPVVLRKKYQSAWLQAICYPVNFLYQSFLRNRKVNLYNLKITPQVVYLERMLNDRYDISGRRIRIKKSIRYEPAYIFLEVEAKPRYIYTQQENNTVALYTVSETQLNPVDFVVNVPADVVFNELEMRGMLDAKVLPNKTYSIVRI